MGIILLDEGRKDKSAPLPSQLVSTFFKAYKKAHAAPTPRIVNYLLNMSIRYILLKVRLLLLEIQKQGICLRFWCMGIEECSMWVSGDGNWICKLLYIIQDNNRQLGHQWVSLTELSDSVLESAVFYWVPLSFRTIVINCSLIGLMCWTQCRCKTQSMNNLPYTSIHTKKDDLCGSSFCLRPPMQEKTSHCIMI